MDLDFSNDTSLQAILSSLQEGVALYSPDRRLLFINERMKDLTGGRQELGGELRDVATRHRMFTENGQELSEAEFPIERAFAGEETHNGVFEYVNSAGDHRWLLINCVRIMGADGALRFIMTTVHDISNRKHREDKLRFMVESAKILSVTQEFRERLVEKAKLAVPSLADWAAIDILGDESSKLERVVAIHQDPHQIEFLREFESRYPSDPQAPGSVYNVIRAQKPVFVPLVTDAMIEASITDEAHREAVRKLHLHSVMVVPIVARGKGLGAMTVAYAESGRTYSEDDLQFFMEYCAHVGILLDNARLYNEIMRRDNAKDLFLASLSHELRNPLAPIKSSLELLKYEDLLPQVREEIAIIEHQFDHMAKLLGDLLDVSRFTQGKINIVKRTVELRKLVERALKSTDTLLRTADITLHFTYPSTPLTVHGDETRLEQAVVNLMSNAAKFTPAGGSIWVEVERSGENAVIRVRDTGSGISPDDLPNIFNMYYQGRRETISNAGLGIGLLLVEQILKLHDGTITAESEGLGKGSEFTMTLPLVERTTESEGAHHPKQGTLERRILVVDDNMQAADSLAKLLNKLGASAQAVYSAEETLARDDLALFDVILLDVGMPHIDGYQLVRMLRERGIERPIIALTGYGMSDDKKRALEAGFSAHLTKPVGLKEITQAFESLA